MKHSAPALSVIMTSYNYEDYLPVAIESVLHQSFGDFELIIVESGSSDRSPQIIKDYTEKDSRIRPFFLKQASNSEAYHFGLEHARGHYVARADSDDINLPNRFAAQLRYIKAANLDICGSWYKNIGTKDNCAWCPTSQHAIHIEMLFRVVLINSAMMIKTSVARQHPFDENIVFDDYEWPIRVSKHAKLGNTPMILIHRRRHEEQASILQNKRVQKERRKYRFQHFYSMYPNTPLPDYFALAKVSDKLPFDSVQELSKAGSWLFKFSKSSDRALVKKMRLRWKKACSRSSHLGGGALRVFNEYDLQFQKLLSQ